MSFLRPVAMDRIGIVGLKADRETIVATLHDLGVLQIEAVGKETLDFLEVERGSEVQRRVGDQLIRFRGLRAALPSRPLRGRRAFPTLESVLAATAEVTVDEEVGSLKREEDALLSEEKSLSDEIGLLDRFRFLQAPLDLLTGRSILTFFAEAPADRMTPFLAALPSDAHVLQGPVGKGVGAVVTVRLEQGDAVPRIAQAQSVQLTISPKRDGAPADAVVALRAELTRARSRIAEIRARLGAIADTSGTSIEQIEEALSIEAKKLELYNRFGAGPTSFALEGWVPRRERAALQAKLAAVTGDRAQVYSVAATERAPTLMDNPPGIRWFEFFIRFYALPQADEWDPTWIFALAFPLFFGLMLGDVGYSVVILLVCLWMIAGFPGRTGIPQSIRRMMTTIVPPHGMRSLAYTLVPGCIIGIGAGVVFNELFGVHFLPFTILDPIAGIGTLLLFSGYVGLTMVTIGFGLGAIKEYYHGHIRGAAGKIGGILFAVGIVILGLAVIHTQFAPTLNFSVGLVLLLVGLVTMLGTEGAMHGLLGTIEALSHILSYTRLIGILLASVVLALVINTIANGWVHSGSVFLAVAAILLLIIGQGFNIVVGVFEPGIQGVRLLFVEHLSKFYEGNGKSFHPLKSIRRATISSPPTS